MNPSEHYSRSEELVAQAERDLGVTDGTEEFEAARRDRIAAAQVHADLANAGALMRLVALYTKNLPPPATDSPRN